MVASISPKEMTTQFVNLMIDLLGEERGLHGVEGYGGHRCFDEGGPTSHGKYLVCHPSIRRRILSNKY